MELHGTGGAGWGKWWIVALRCVTLAALILYLGLELRSSKLGVVATIRQFGLAFWILCAGYLAANLVYATEALHAFVSQQIAAAVFIVDVALVCGMAYLAGQADPPFYLAFFLAILVAAMSGQSTVALGGSLVAATVYALMATQGSFGAAQAIDTESSFEHVMKGPIWPYVLLLVSTALLVSILAGSTRRRLGQKQGVKRALALSSGLASLFDLSRSQATGSQLLDDFAREIGQEIFLANDCRIFVLSSSEGSLVSQGGGAVPSPLEEPFETAEILFRGRHAEETADPAAYRSAIRAPILSGGEDAVYGALWVARTDPDLPDLDADDCRLAASLAAHIGIAIRNGQMLKKVEQARAESEDTLAKLKDTQERLLHSEKMSVVGEVVSRVAHELNTPLTSVLGTVELLQEQAPPGQSSRGLQTIHRQVSRCRALVAGMVKAIGRHKGSRIPVDLNSMVVEAINGMNDRLREASIIVHYDLSKTMPVLFVDRDPISRVIAHILDNSYRAMVRNTTAVRRLSIQSWAESDWVRLSISDTGPGINLDSLLQVFQPFFSTDVDGVRENLRGLGLSVAYQVMKEHEGNISASTRGAGGTEIILEFPRPKSDIPRGRAITVRRQLARVLLVDPDPTLAGVLQDALVGHARIFSAGTAREAFALLESGELVDVAVAELFVRGMQPGELLEGLVSRCDRLRGRVMWTSSASVSDEAEAVIARSSGVFLAKPFGIAELRTAVGGLLGRDLGPRIVRTVRPGEAQPDVLPRPAN